MPASSPCMLCHKPLPSLTFDCSFVRRSHWRVFRPSVLCHPTTIDPGWCFFFRVCVCAFAPSRLALFLAGGDIAHDVK